jgi:hypothetical protein
MTEGCSCLAEEACAKEPLGGRLTALSLSEGMDEVDHREAHPAS